jgi:hypothetical protein
MSDEAVQYRNALRKAGQPWSRRGVRTVGGGIVALLALNVVMTLGVGVPYAVYLMLAALCVIAAGWVMLIAAVVKRRRWAKDHPIADAPLDTASLTGAP